MSPEGHASSSQARRLLQFDVPSMFMYSVVTIFSHEIRDIGVWSYCLRVSGGDSLAYW